MSTNTKYMTIIYKYTKWFLNQEVSISSGFLLNYFAVSFYFFYTAKSHSDNERACQREVSNEKGRHSSTKNLIEILHK